MRAVNTVELIASKFGQDAVSAAGIFSRFIKLTKLYLKRMQFHQFGLNKPTNRYLFGLTAPSMIAPCLLVAKAKRPLM